MTFANNFLYTKSMKKKITIDSLARMSQDQFSRIDERFDTLETNMETQFGKVNNTLKTILDIVIEIPSKKSFDRLEDKVQTIDARLTSVEMKVAKK